MRRRPFVRRELVALVPATCIMKPESPLTSRLPCAMLAHVTRFTRAPELWAWMGCCLRWHDQWVLLQRVRGVYSDPLACYRDLHAALDRAVLTLCFDADHAIALVAPRLEHTCRVGDARGVRAQLRAGVDANEVMEDESPRAGPSAGATALMVAARFGHVECVRLLVAAGARLEAETTSGEYTPLIYAVEQGHRECVQALLAARADIEHRDCCKMTPLAVAALWGHTAICSDLLTAKPQQDSTHESLSIACEHGYGECARLLLAHNADVAHVDDRGATALTHAC